jgi:2,4-dienoyl-CoA reductase-like NADH-dependent reductase (Old Yellow Enzyme family)
LKRLGYDYVCVSSGGAALHARITGEPGYQLPFARRVRERSGLVTRGVSLIYAPRQAEEALANGDCDLVAIGRAFLADPRWGWRAAQALGATPMVPPAYERSVGSRWPGSTALAFQ